MSSRTSMALIGGAAAAATTALVAPGAFVSAPSSQGGLLEQHAPSLLRAGEVRSSPEAASQASSAALTGAGLFVVGAAASSTVARRSAKQQSRTTVCAFESELGVQAPAGFWDPMGFAADGNIQAFKRRRSVELKHGRICMLACMGYLTPEITGKFPGYLSPSQGLKFDEIPNGLGAIAKVPALGWLQIVAYFGFVEKQGGFDDYKTGTPGDYGWKVLTDKDPEKLRYKLNAELANGRLAMIAIMAMLFQNGTIGDTSPDMWVGLARAFEAELGVQAPAGFWDPMGFAADGNIQAFKRRRSVELKHGRICMLATMGYLTPEITGKFPGYLSPSQGLKFDEIPNGLGAIAKVPALGWLQIVAYFGFVEKQGGFDDYKTGTPGDYGWKVLTDKDPEKLRYKLNAELANGRLAMIASMAMLFQNGTIGDTSPDMWVGLARAFESELGVQAPAGFWDPMGFAADGNIQAFKRRRSVELKHGRICMLATMGYLTPEITGKFPGYLSPSQGLKFDEIPNGLGAIAKVPALGWLQIVAYFGFVEKQGGFEDYKTGTPGDYGWKVLTDKDPEKLRYKLNAELANGRLAMIAVMAMLFQNGTIGDTSPDMWVGLAR